MYYNTNRRQIYERNGHPSSMGQALDRDKDSDFSKQLHNVLEQRFHPNSPNAVWCTDITYLWTFEGFVYLTTIMDLYARKIIAWTLSRSLDVSCVLETIDKAKARRDTSNPLILHSDRGSQYVSKAYREATKNFQLSYSRKATLIVYYVLNLRLPYPYCIVL